MHGLTKIISGDSVDFTTSVAAYPATDSWALSYRLVPRFATPVQAAITLTATTYEVSSYRVQVAPSTSATWAAGAYSWASYVSKAGQRITLESPIPADIQGVIDLLHSAQNAK